MAAIAAACVFLPSCTQESDVGGTKVGVTMQGLTRYVYTTVNSNAGAPLAQGAHPAFEALRAFAMSQHAEAGADFWHCGTPDNKTFTCYHPGDNPTSGATYIYVICGATVGQCNLYVTYAPNQTSQITRVTRARDFQAQLSYAGTDRDVDTSFVFWDGATGVASPVWGFFYKDVP